MKPEAKISSEVMMTSKEETLRNRKPAKTMEEFARVVTVAKAFGLENKLDEFLQPGERPLYQEYITKLVQEKTAKVAEVQSKVAALKAEDQQAAAEQAQKIRSKYNIPLPRLGRNEVVRPAEKKVKEIIYSRDGEAVGVEYEEEPEAEKTVMIQQKRGDELAAPSERTVMMNIPPQVLKKPEATKPLPTPSRWERFKNFFRS